MVVLATEPGSNLLTVTASGKLTDSDYRQLVPEVEKLIDAFGKIRVLFEMQNFHGWGAAALWDDIKFDAKHFNDIERIAMIGDKQWEKGMAIFCKPFTSADVRFFHPDERGEALQWVSADVPQPG